VNLNGKERSKVKENQESKQGKEIKIRLFYQNILLIFFLSCKILIFFIFNILLLFNFYY